MTQKNRYDGALKELLSSHATAHDDLRVFVFEDPHYQTLRLLEVSQDFLSGSVSPVTFGASRDIPVESSVILASEEEFEGISSGRLELPEEWSRDHMRQIWPAA